MSSGILYNICIIFTSYFCALRTKDIGFVPEIPRFLGNTSSIYPFFDAEIPTDSPTKKSAQKIILCGFRLLECQLILQRLHADKQTLHQLNHKPF